MRRIFAAAIIGLCFFGIAARASAHVWSADGNISVLMHVNPDDNPVAGEPAALLFGIVDSSNRFNGECLCQVSVSEGGKVLLDKPLIPWFGGLSLYSYFMPFTFPDPNIYHIVVTGSPNAEGAFQNFTVSYDERVEQSRFSADTGPIFDAAAACLALLIGAALYFCYRELRS